MSRTIKHHVSRNKAKMSKLEKGTKTSMRNKMMKELENDDYKEINNLA